ncbi:MAG: hypothetical protein RIM99_12915 [Cyclobacteriaceae bacterium]
MSHINNQSHLVFIALICLCIAFSCKSVKTESSETLHVLYMLLEEEVSPADIPEVKKYTVEKMSRASRSQNAWVVYILSDDKTEKILTSIGESKSIKEINPLDDSNSKPSNSTNDKKGKSAPIN